jgi:hypothetical protein
MIPSLSRVFYQRQWQKLNENNEPSGGTSKYVGVCRSLIRELDTRNPAESDLGGGLAKPH